MHNGNRDDRNPLRVTMRLRFNDTARTLVSLYVPSAFVSLGQGMLVPITPALAEAFNVPLGLAAQVVSAHLLGRLVLMIPSGVLVDRFGRRAAMIAGPVLIVICALITLLTTNFYVLLAAQFLAGGGAGLWQLGREIIAVDLVPASARGRVMSLFIGVSTVGVALGPVLGGALTDLVSFRAVFASYLLIAIGVLLISVTLVDAGGPHRRHDRAAATGGVLDVISPIYRVTYLVLIFSTLAATLRTTVSQAMLPLYAGAELGYSSTEVGFLFGVMGGTNLLVLGVAGWVSDTLGRKAAVVPAAVMSGVAFVLYPFATSLMALAGVTVLIGVASGFAMGSMTIYTYDIAPDHARGRLQSLRRVIGETSGTAGPMIGGLLATVMNPGMTFLVFAPIHIVSAVLLMAFARETVGRNVPKEGAGMAV